MTPGRTDRNSRNPQNSSSNPLFDTKALSGKDRAFQCIPPAYGKNSASLLRSSSGNHVVPEATPRRSKVARLIPRLLAYATAASESVGIEQPPSPAAMAAD